SFLHGCYWHGHYCHLRKIPSTNREYWKKKFLANHERHRRKLKELLKLGYSCLTVWQCEILNQPRTKRKLLRFLNTANSRNGQVQRTARLQPVVPSYELNSSSKCVSRSLC